MPSKTSKLTHAHKFEAIGTHWSIETGRSLSSDLKEKIDKCICDFDVIYSRFRDDSVVAKMSIAAGEYDVGADSSKLALLYKKLYNATKGAVTPWIGEGMVAGGYDKNYSLVPSSPIPAPKWDDDIKWHGRTIVTKKPVILDVGAAGKGLLVDKIAVILQNEGIDNFVVDASGDITCRGNVSQTIGLENPYDSKKVIGSIEISNASLCASASNRRRWADGWHHVLDGRTGTSTNEVVATWVVAKNTMVADGLATALFFVGSEKLDGVDDFQFVRLMSDGKIEKSDNFVGQLYI